MTDKIAGPQRIAAFLLSRSAEEASAILATFDQELVTQVAAAMSDLDPRLEESGTVDELYRTFARDLTGKPALQAYGDDELSTVLSQAFGPGKANEVIASILERRLRSRPFLAIEDKSPATIARVLSQESNPVCAVVLSYLPPATAAAIIAAFEDDKALDSMRRMATLKAPGTRVITAIAEDLEQRLKEVDDADGEADESERLKSVATILGFSKPEIEKGVIESIAEDDAEIANELREYMFMWDDIADVDRRVMQKILGTVDTKTLSISIKGCPPAVEENLMSNLSARVRDMVAEERELAGPVALSAVMDAREEILRNIRAMIETGEFSPSRAGEELVS